MTDAPERLASTYLARLDLLLAPADPELRRDVVGGIAEHLDEAARDGDESIRRAIGRLGSPEDVAAAALEGTPRRASRAPGLIAIWAGAATLTITVLASGAIGATLAVSAHFDEDADWSISPLLAWLAALALLTMTIVGVIVVWATRSWPRRSRIGLTAVAVGGLAVFAVADPLGQALPPGAGFLLAPLILLAAGLLAALTLRWAVIATVR